MSLWLCPIQLSWSDHSLSYTVYSAYLSVSLACFCSTTLHWISSVSSTLTLRSLLDLSCNTLVVSIYAPSIFTGSPLGNYSFRNLIWIGVSVSWPSPHIWMIANDRQWSPMIANDRQWSSMIVKCFAIAEFAFSSWGRSRHTKHVDTALNDTCRIHRLFKGYPNTLLVCTGGDSPSLRTPKGLAVPQIAAFKK